MSSGSVAYPLLAVDVLSKIKHSNQSSMDTVHLYTPPETPRYVIWRQKAEENETIMLPGEQFFSMLVGRDRYRQMKAWGTPVSTSKQAKLLDELLVAFETDPLEDGIYHHAEQIIRKALRFSEDQQVLDWFKSFSLDTKHPSFAASVLRCLGRQANLGTYSWRAELVHRGLTLDNVEIRDAAVQAAESWGDHELANILKLHHETEPWLREYILDVINDLGE